MNGISGLIYQETRVVIKVFIENMISDTVTYTKHAKHKQRARNKYYQGIFDFILKITIIYYLLIRFFLNITPAHGRSLGHIKITQQYFHHKH